MAEALEGEGTSGRAFGGVFGVLVAALGLATVISFVALSLTFFGAWKAAIGTNILAVLAAVVVWKRTLVPSRLPSVVIVTTLLSTVTMAGLLVGTWTVQARHDARLSEMVNELCTLKLSGGSIEDCGGSISNTGNGNSCRYLATAVVAGDTRSPAVASALEAQGFEPTELDVWGEPMNDGRLYVQDGGDLRLFIQSSWQDDEGDPRCT